MIYITNIGLVFVPEAVSSNEARSRSTRQSQLYNILLVAVPEAVSSLNEARGIS